jgi:hypothetical protein
MLPKDAGDYQVAEILESKNPDVISLVAEYRGIAIAFVSATAQVDLNIFLESHSLETYTDLLNSTNFEIIHKMKPVLIIFRVSFEDHSINY